MPTTTTPSRERGCTVAVMREPVPGTTVATTCGNVAVYRSPAGLWSGGQDVCRVCAAGLTPTDRARLVHVYAGED